MTLIGAAVANTAKGKLDAIRQFERSIGRELPAVRLYCQLDGGWSPDYDAVRTSDGGRHIVLSLEAQDWHACAYGLNGTPALMDTWARRLATWKGPVHVVFNHEPDNPPTAHGTATDYRRAWRRWVDACRRAGASNVRHTWTPTAWGFQNPLRIASYWPGDEWVDVVGADGYNWASSRPGQVSPWRTFTQVFEAPRLFADRHRKPCAAIETGTVEKPGVLQAKADWIRDIAKATDMELVVYYSQQDPNPAITSRWPIHTSLPAVNAFSWLVQQSTGRSG